MPPVPLTMDTIYNGACRRGHPYTLESTRVIPPVGNKGLARACRICLNITLVARRYPDGAPPPRPQNSAAPDHVIQHWKDVAEGGQEALVKEVSAMLDDMAGPYAVGVMPDDVFWAKFREVFADGFPL